MLRDLNKRFRKMQDAQSVDFDPLYVAGTFLDPRYKLILSSEQMKVAKRMIVNAATSSTATSSHSEAEEMEEQTVQAQEPKQKRFKHLATVLAKKRELLGTSKAGTEKIDNELSRYQVELHELDEADDPMDFWVCPWNANSHRSHSWRMTSCQFLHPLPLLRGSSQRVGILAWVKETV